MLADAQKQIDSLLPKLEAMQSAKDVARMRFVQILDDSSDWSAKIDVSTAERVGLTTSEVHEYEGPQGRGWSLIAMAEEGGVLFHKVVHFGPEKFREHDWTKVTTPEELVIK